jgi:hypothetical protein
VFISFVALTLLQSCRANPFGLYLPQPDFLALKGGGQGVGTAGAASGDGLPLHRSALGSEQSEGQSDPKSARLFALDEIRKVEQKERHEVNGAQTAHTAQILRDLLVLMEPEQVDHLTDVFLRQGHESDMHALHDALQRSLIEVKAGCAQRTSKMCDEARVQAYQSSLEAIRVRFIVENLPLVEVEPFAVDYLRNASPLQESMLERIAGQPYSSASSSSDFKKGKPTFFMPGDETAFSKRDIHIHLHGNLESTSGSSNAAAAAKRDIPTASDGLTVTTEALVKRENDKGGMVKRSASMSPYDTLLKRQPTHYVMPDVPKP